MKSEDLSRSDGRPLPRSGYTEQPRASALGKALVKGALKVAPDIWRAGSKTCGEPKDHLGRRFSSFVPPSQNYGGQAGRCSRYAYPGLKPWAVLSSCFEQNPTTTGRDRSIRVPQALTARTSASSVESLRSFSPCGRHCLVLLSKKADLI
jgi:hypothetical protein